jgi:uncharacterized membrane protein YdfJ with MMPL/SSD domain
VSTQRKRRNTGRLFSKLWLPAVALVMIAIIAYGVNKVRHASDAISYPPSTSSIPATVVQIITAAFVLAGTMLALLSSDVINIGQAGSTICLGLIFDMLIVRLFLVMPLARLLGPWFWWPQRVHREPSLNR